jgi:arylsulfatase A-like enzyme
VVSAWIQWRRRSRSQPFFSYLNFQSNHFPYEIPSNVEHTRVPFELDFPATFFAYPKSRTGVLLNRYYNAFEYSDQQLGRIIESLKEDGLWDQTAVIVVSDHGEAFYEHDQPTHGSALYEEQIRSLLMIKLPGRAARIVEQPVSHLDIVPSLLDYLDLPPHGNFQGSSEIFEPAYTANGRPFLFSIQGITSEDGVLQDEWKYVANWDRRSRLLFDLSTDPGEANNLYPEGSEMAGDMDETLHRLLESQLSYYRDKSWTRGNYIRPLH